MPNHNAFTDETSGIALLPLLLLLIMQRPLLFIQLFFLIPLTSALYRPDQIPLNGKRV
jgi:hypothetical protein